MSLLYIYQMYNKLENLIVIYKEKLKPYNISYNYYNNFISAIQIEIEKTSKIFSTKTISYYKILKIINLIFLVLF